MLPHNRTIVADARMVELCFWVRLVTHQAVFMTYFHRLTI